MNLSLESRFQELWLGSIQSVKGMTIIPLCSDVMYDGIADPSALKMEGNQNYGQMQFRNEDAKIAIVPSNFMAIVKSSVQDHAMGSAGFVEGSSRRRFDNACCIQSSQGGYIKEGMESEFSILPLSLRGKLKGNKRTENKMNRLWDDIKKFNKNVTKQSGAHLEFFFKEYKDELDEFIAEFEPVENQVGALIFFGNELVGIEVAPTNTFWLESWKWLIRGCYGAEFVRQNKLGRNFERLPLPSLSAASSVGEIRGIIENHIEDFVFQFASKVSGNWKMVSSIYQENPTNRLVFVSANDLNGDMLFVGNEGENKPVYISLYHKSIDKGSKV